MILKGSLKRGNMNILIPGGSGFLGYHLTRELLDKGNSVTCLDIIAPDSAFRLQPFFHNPDFKYFWKSLHDVSTQDLEGYDVVVVQKAAFDTVYHEMIYFFTLGSLINLFNQLDMRVFKADLVSVLAAANC